MHFNNIIIDPLNRMRMTLYHCLGIFHASITLSRWVGKYSWAIPEIKQKESSGLEMLTSCFHFREGILFCYLVAHDVKQARHGIEGLSQPDGTNISFKQAR